MSIRRLFPADFLASTHESGVFDPKTWLVTVGTGPERDHTPPSITKGGLLERMQTLLELLPTSLVEAARQTLTEDNRYTRDPIWQVKSTQKAWGMEEEFSANYRWIDQTSGDYQEAEGALHGFLESVYTLVDKLAFSGGECPEHLEEAIRFREQNSDQSVEITEKILGGQLAESPELLKLAQEEHWAGVWQKRYYVEHEELIATFFTEEAADLYIKKHGHRHRRGGELYTYVDSCMNQPQILLIRELLRALAVAEKQLQASNG